DHEGVFAPSEHLEIVLTNTMTEELLRIWQLVGRGPYEPSLAYELRGLRLDARALARGGG
ncbi:MAG: Pvc16 family protein, partial [Gemmatimonadaceae bacterium]